MSVRVEPVRTEIVGTTDNGLSTRDCGNGLVGGPSDAVCFVSWLAIGLTVGLFWWSVFRALAHLIQPLWAR